MTRTMKIIMTLSVMLNVLLLGAVGSYAYKATQHKPAWRENVREQLSPEGQHHMARTFRKVKGEMKDNFQDARRLRHDMMAVIEAEDFDGQAYDELAQEMIEMHTAMMRAKMETHKKLAQELPAEDRKLLAKKLSHLGSGPPKGHRDRNKPDQTWGPKPHISP